MTPEEQRQLGIKAVETFPELFTDGEHNWKEVGNYVQCDKCKSLLGTTRVDSPCPSPDPIDVNDWNVAIEIYRSMDVCGRVNTMTELTQIFLQEIDDYKNTADLIGSSDDLPLQTDCWLLGTGEPKHLILAACKTREADNG